MEVVKVPPQSSFSSSTFVVQRSQPLTRKGSLCNEESSLDSREKKGGRGEMKWRQRYKEGKFIQIY